MSFPKYSRYKETQVAWLREVPTSWQVASGRRMFAKVREPARPGDPQLSSTQRYGVIPQTLFIELEDQKVMLALGGTSSFQHVEPGDFVISLRSFQGGIEKSNYAGCVSPAYTVLRPRSKFDARYWSYVLKSEPYVRALQAMTDGIRDGKAISYLQFGQVGLPVPPVAEQAAIATFLDREVGKVDELVAEQQRLIELLKEKRQAVISHAVTKGLDPDAPMKPSGIGHVPAHWRVLALRHLIGRIEQGWSPPCLNEPAPEGEWGVLKVGCGNNQRFNPHEQKALPPTVSPQEQYEVVEGDILMSRGNTLDLVGSAVLVPDTRRKLLLSDLLYRFRARTDRLLPEYLVAVLGADQTRFQIERDARGTSPSMKKISHNIIKSILIPLPEIHEQAAILEKIRREAESIDRLIVEAETAIGLLEERRAALISAAVTGQIDVRGLAEKAAA